MHTTIGVRYDPMARIFTDQALYVVPDLEADDAPKVDDPGMENFRLLTSMTFEFRR